MQNVPTPRCRCEAHAVLVGTRNAEWDAKMLCDSCSFSAKWCSNAVQAAQSEAPRSRPQVLDPKAIIAMPSGVVLSNVAMAYAPLAPFGCGRKETADGCAMRSINEAATDRARDEREKFVPHSVFGRFYLLYPTGRPFVVIDCITVNRPRGRADHPRRHSHLKG